MSTYAVVKTGGKQYLVRENDEIVVEHVEGDLGANVELPALSVFDSESAKIEFGAPLMKTMVMAQIKEQARGEKIRVAKFKAKVRYRKVRGFRPTLTKLQIVKI